MIEKMRREWDKYTPLNQAFGVGIALLGILTLICRPIEAAKHPLSAITTPLYQGCLILVLVLAWERWMEDERERRELVRAGVPINRGDRYEKWITFSLTLISSVCAIISLFL